MVYRGRIRAEDALRPAGDDDEVAAIATFSVGKLRETLGAQPERFASGISSSFALYDEDRSSS
ncbi:MAG: hypothetical protein ACP5JG_13410 [Anaerolineae bacterium]